MEEQTDRQTFLLHEHRTAISEKLIFLWEGISETVISLQIFSLISYSANTDFMYSCYSYHLSLSALKYCIKEIDYHLLHAYAFIFSPEREAHGVGNYLLYFLCTFDVHK